MSAGMMHAVMEQTIPITTAMMIIESWNWPSGVPHGSFTIVHTTPVTLLVAFERARRYISHFENTFY
jgi:hypothetical protein